MRNLLMKLLSALLIAALAVPCVAVAEGSIEAGEAAVEAAMDDAVTDGTEAEDAAPGENVPTEVVDAAVSEKAEAELDDAPLFEAQPVIEEAVGLIEEENEAEKLMAPAGEIAIDAAHFPDAAFRAYVSAFDADKSGGLSNAEISNVNSITLSSGGVAVTDPITVSVDARSLQGIGCFTNLTSLYCSGLNLGSLDLSGNNKLTDVRCNSCNLTSLTLGSQPDLRQLQCQGNQLAALDISGCAVLAQYVNAACFSSSCVTANNPLSWVTYTDDAKTGNYTAWLDCDATTALTGGSPVTIVTEKKVTLPVGTVFSTYNTQYSSSYTNRIAASSNKKVVAKNGNGSWTAKAKGTAKITFPLKKKKILVVTVKVVKAAAPAAPVVAPENAITVTKNMKTSVLVGTTHQIFLNGKTGKGFKSSKKKVATVDKNGNIAAVGAGKTKITFKVGKKKRTLTLTVVDPTTPTAIYLDKSGTVAAKVGEPQTITAAFPAGTTSDIKWTSSNKKVATVSNGVVTFKKKGKVTITATAVKGKKKAKVKFVVSK